MAELPWEDNLLERKLESDLKDLLKTLVAFSNSVKPGHVATILIGEKDDGTVQGVTNPNNIQKKIRKECEKIYPPILWRSKVYEKNGKYCVRIEIEHDGETPHFGGPAWIRKGSETVIATDEIFQRLIDLRLGKVHELSKWLNKDVTVHGDTSNTPEHAIHETVWESSQGTRDWVEKKAYHRSWEDIESAEIVLVTNHWVSFERVRSGTVQRVSETLSKISLSYDDERDRLLVIIDY